MSLEEIEACSDDIKCPYRSYINAPFSCVRGQKHDRDWKAQRGGLQKFRLPMGAKKGVNRRACEAYRSGYGLLKAMKTVTVMERALSPVEILRSLHEARFSLRDVCSILTEVLSVLRLVERRKLCSVPPLEMQLIFLLQLCLHYLAPYTPTSDRLPDFFCIL